MEVGEHYAYRPGTSGTFHEAVLLAIGVKRPPRVRIRLVGDEWEGEDRWVSPARLEVLWANIVEYRKADLALKRLLAVPGPSKAEWEAATQVYLCSPEIDPAIDLHSYGSRGIAVIRDADLLSEATGLTVSNLLSHPETIRDESGISVPWPITELIVRALALRRPDRILKYVRERNREVQIESVVGREVPAWVTGTAFRIDGERVLADYEERVKPELDQLLAWVGEETATPLRTLEEAQAELSRVGEIAQRAIFELKRLRSNRLADGLLAELLDPQPRAMNSSTRYRWVLSNEDES